MEGNTHSLRVRCEIFSGSELTTIEQEDRCDEVPVNHFFERAYGRAVGGRRRKNGYVKARSQAGVQN